MQQFIKQSRSLSWVGMTAFLLVGFISATFSSTASENSDFIKERAHAQFMKLPLSFEKNEGQVDASVKYTTRGPGYAFYFTPNQIVLALHKSSKENQEAPNLLKIQFVGAQPNPLINGIDQQAAKSHYFIGNKQEKWRNDIPHFAKVVYENVYPGIDVVFYGNQEKFEYDICVAPGANPQEVRLQIDGAKNFLVDNSGNLCIQFDNHEEVQMQKPMIYQLIESKKIAVDGQFILLAHNEVGFALGDYDQTQELIIDPVLVYSTYLGGSGNDRGNDIAVDSEGNTYVTGSTDSLNFPLMNPLQPVYGGGISDVFITKINANGSALIYSTYLGGKGTDQGVGIAVDQKGNAYITGETNSPDFPLMHPIQPAFGGDFRDAFITKIDATGSNLIYSTYLGGSGDDRGNAITVDKDENAYVTGFTSSPNFPLVNPLQPVYGGSADAFVTKINAEGSAFVYSTYLGGNGLESGVDIALDKEKNIYITGITASQNFPLANPLQPIFGGGPFDAFITKINASGTALIYSTYLGGNGFDAGNGIDTDINGNAYVTGITNSLNFPLKNPLQPVYGGGFNDAFISKINPDGSALVYSTYLGGSGNDTGNGIAVDSNGNAYVIGSTDSLNFPLTNPLQPLFGGVRDAFVTKINASGSSLIFSTYLGGSGQDFGGKITLDNNGNAYIVGSTSSTDFPLANPLQPTYGGGTFDAFVAKLAIGTPTITGISPNAGPTNGGTAVTITGTNFANATQVFFESTSATFVINSDTQITAIAPPGTGTVDVTVVTPGGTSAISAAGQFTYKTLPPRDLKGKQVIKEHPGKRIPCVRIE